MNSLKQFWFWALLLFLIVIALLASTIWQTSPVQQQNITASDQPALSDQPLSASSDAVPSAVDSKPDPSFPAPAKKLHKVIASTEAESEVQNKLQQQTQELDEQLANLNQQLREKGVAVPEKAVELPATTTTTNNGDTSKRLDAIKKHIETKNTQ